MGRSLGYRGGARLPRCRGSPWHPGPGGRRRGHPGGHLGAEAQLEKAAHKSKSVLDSRDYEDQGANDDAGTPFRRAHVRCSFRGRDMSSNEHTKGGGGDQYPRGQGRIFSGDPFVCFAPSPAKFLPPRRQHLILGTPTKRYRSIKATEYERLYSVMEISRL